MASLARAFPIASVLRSVAVSAIRAWPRFPLSPAAFPHEGAVPACDRDTGARAEPGPRQAGSGLCQPPRGPPTAGPRARPGAGPSGLGRRQRPGGQGSVRLVRRRGAALTGPATDRTDDPPPAAAAPVAALAPPEPNFHDGPGAPAPGRATPPLPRRVNSGPTVSAERSTSPATRRASAAGRPRRRACAIKLVAVTINTRGQPMRIAGAA